MVQIIIGDKGKGKTKVMINKANERILCSEGTIVYIDKNIKHMYELNNKVRLISIKDYLVENYQEFIGFLCGIISQDHDLECVFVDSLLKVSHIDEQELEQIVNKIRKLSEQFAVDFILSVTMQPDQIPESFKETPIEVL